MIGIVFLSLVALATLMVSPRFAVLWIWPVAGVLPPVVRVTVGGFTADVLLVAILCVVLKLLVRDARMKRDDAGVRVSLRGDTVASILALCTGLFALLLVIHLVVDPGNQGALATTYRVLVEVIVVSLVVARLLADHTMEREEIVKAWSVLAVVAVGVAAVEWLSGGYVFGDNLGLFREARRGGNLRAQAFLPHPIVFGLVCAVLASYWAFSDRKLASRASWIALMLAGVYFSGSRGPFIAVAVAVIFVWTIRRVRGKTARTSLLLICAVPLASEIYRLITVRAYVGGSNALETSTQYRSALMSAGWRSVMETPLGFGPGALPERSILSESIFGTIDLSMSVDNAYLLLALEYGIPGLVLAIVSLACIISLATRPSILSRHPGSSAMFLAILVGGVTVSLVSWTVVCLLLGTTIGAVLGHHWSSTKPRERGAVGGVEDRAELGERYE